MAFFDKFPYSNFHELNLDWIIQKIRHIDDSVAESAASAGASAASASASDQSARASAASAEASAASAEAAAGSETAAAESAVGIEAAREQIYMNTARLDNLIVDGQQTEGNTELLDIRVGGNGVTYPTAGDAVRGQFNEVNDAFNNTVEEKSLFYPFFFNKGKYIAADGSLANDANYNTSDFIPVTPGKTYTGNWTNRSAFYDVNKSFIAGSRTNQVYPVTAPADAAFVLIDWYKNAKSEFDIVFVEGEIIPPYKNTVKIANKIDASLDRFMDTTVNLFDCANIHTGKNINANGTLSDAAGYETSDYIPVEEGSTYTGNFTNHCAFYDSAHKYITGSRTNIVFTVTAPSGAAYACIDWNKTVIKADAIMFIKGTLLPEQYSPKYEPKYLIPLAKVSGSENLIERTANLFSKQGIKDGKYIATDGTLSSNENSATSDFIPVTPGETYTGNWTNRSAFYDVNKSFIAGSRTNQVYPVTAPANAAFMRIDYNTQSKTADQIMVVHASIVPRTYMPYYKPFYNIPIGSIPDINKAGLWTGKKWSAYGDSITAIANGNGLNIGWAKYVNAAILFEYFYGRGVGAQSYAWKTAGGSATFINADGTYNSRDDTKNKDNYSGSIPSGTTLCRGCFCSWDRITHMYPASIKDDIDLIYIMGGTNDIHNTTDPVFIQNDNTDPEWAESEYYSTYGGDYNIETIRGGIASCIMKMQAWMPNAMIIIGTPLSGREVNNYELGAGEYEKAEDVRVVAKMASIPLIDVYATCGINPWNRDTYIEDEVHPYLEAGKKMLAQAVTEGLKNYIPRIN